jgi:hypothetical protein
LDLWEYSYSGYFAFVAFVEFGSAAAMALRFVGLSVPVPAVLVLGLLVFLLADNRAH